MATRRRWGRWGSVAAALVLLFCATSAQASSKSVPLPVIQGYISQVVGIPLTISCEPDATFNPAWDGYTNIDAAGTILPVIHVRQSICAGAENADHKQNPHPTIYVTADGQRADITTGTALLVIEHEAMHIALQSHDEGLVECTAWRNRWPFVRLFGLPGWVATMVMAGMTWNHQQSPAQYRSTC